MIFQLFSLLFHILSRTPDSKTIYIVVNPKKDGTPKYKYVVLSRDSPYFVKIIPNHFQNIPKKMFSKCWSFWSATYLFSVVDAFFSKRSAFKWERIFCSSACWPIPSLLWGWCYSRSHPEEGKHRLARSFNHSFRYIDNLLSLNNPGFGDLIHHIYPTEHEIKDTTDAGKSAAYLDLHLEIDGNGKLFFKLYYTTNATTFHSILSIFLSSVQTSLQYLFKKFSYHMNKSYVMPDHALKLH